MDRCLLANISQRGSDRLVLPFNTLQVKRRRLEPLKSLIQQDAPARKRAGCHHHQQQLAQRKPPPAKTWLRGLIHAVDCIHRVHSSAEPRPPDAPALKPPRPPRCSCMLITTRAWL